MYRALYRKFRPQYFCDVVGQEHITQTLKNQLEMGKVFHAYLFTGTRGTGKTTCAKILAKAVNCKNLKSGDPCGECEACKAIDSGEVMDITEIDAASNNSVDDIRELRERVAFAPADLKYRVYIIDEVHMLTTAAFNALLKTLEEPPAHVVFILATTEVHKLPATILSRCQRFDFKRINNSAMIGRINAVAEAEGFTVEDNAAKLICSLADGGMRDALSIVDLCSAKSKTITEQVVQEVCSMASTHNLVQLSEFISNKSVNSALELVNSLYADSVDMARLTNDLIGHYRNILMVKVLKGENVPVVCSAEHLTELKALAEKESIANLMHILRVLTDCFAAMKNSNARLELEMALITLCSNQAAADTGSLNARITALEQRLEKGNFGFAPSKPLPAESEPKAEPMHKDLDEEIPLPDTAPAADFNESEIEQPPLKQSGEEVFSQWNEVLGILKADCPIMYGVLNDSKAYIKGDLLLIDAKNPAFRSLVKGDNATYRDHIRKAVAAVSGKVYKLGPYSAGKTEEPNSTDPLAVLAQKLNNL